MISKLLKITNDKYQISNKSQNNKYQYLKQSCFLKIE